MTNTNKQTTLLRLQQ